MFRIRCDLQKEKKMISIMDLEKIRQEFQHCECGFNHELTLKAVEIEPNLVHRVGEILAKHNFPTKILLVADRHTIQASDGILKSLERFDVKRQLYDDLRIAELDESRRIEALADDCQGILAVGTGSIHDICRYAAAQADKPLCLFATAPSMDGFASYNAALISNHFKDTYAAKTPDIILADTKILAAAPRELKAAGFGDMVAKYVALIDWQVSHLITNEMYCPKVADLTRKAADHIMSLSKRIQATDEVSARAVFEGLLLTGIGMGFTQSSRPASGTEHILSHYWECMNLLDGVPSHFHGKKVGIATLLIMEKYQELAKMEDIIAFPEKLDWDAILSNFKELAPIVRKINFPRTITDGIRPVDIVNKWPRIREIIHSVPSYDSILLAMKEAGCATDVSEIGISESLKQKGLAVHPFMRNRLSLYRLSNMIASKQA
jgi:glycerol-1-phosphate dehydrogenase [NAD(P)+]